MGFAMRSVLGAASGVDAELGEAITPGYSGEPRLLIVEDGVEERMLLSSFLLSRGIAVETVATCGAALDRMDQENPPPVLLIDWLLPDRPGIDLVKILRNEEAQGLRPRSHCIMTTGIDDRTSIERAKKTGADDYLIKPLHPTEVLECVSAVFAAAGIMCDVADKPRRHKALDLFRRPGEHT